MIKKFKIYEQLNINLRKKAILYNNRKEMTDIVDKLYELGERTYRSRESLQNSKRLRMFFYFHPGDYAFVRSEDPNILDKLEKMTYGEFMELGGNVKYKKLEGDKSLDPYDEEDWGWEKIEENTSAFEIIEKLRSSAIRFDNKFEMIEIAKKLIEIGERCFRTVEFLEGSDTYGHSYYRYYNDNGYVRVASLPRGSKIISYKEFMILVGDRKFVKVKNQEIDPYEEEEWGWIYENVLNEIDPYGEEDWDDYTQLLNIWSWDSDYFENVILNRIELPEGEFTIEDFAEIFNNISFSKRKNNFNRVIIIFPSSYYHWNILSKLLHSLVYKGILKVRYSSASGLGNHHNVKIKGNRTIPIFKKN